MKIPFRKWMGTMLIIALIAGFLPTMPVEVSAATPITIVSPVAGDTLTKSPINIVVTVSSDNMTRLTEMYYRVENLTTNQDTGIIKTKAAQKTGEYEVTFTDVDLTEGRNRITVVVGETNTILSTPVTVDFTPVTNITDLRLDSEIFENNRIMPQSQLESFMITGSASGASIVSAYVN
ncbi:MAG: hypothetical protein K6T85_02480, partial [Gorillibacterium sp.]|nr:hypothetical protein [Gorillibacterium sp.]